MHSLKLKKKNLKYTCGKRLNFESHITETDLTLVVKKNEVTYLNEKYCNFIPNYTNDK